jgi:monoamine oxidase
MEDVSAGDDEDTLASSSKSMKLDAMTSAMNQGQEDLYDVIIVGAGLSGLSAARQLMTAKEKKNFIILEARDRVGGRTLDFKTPAGSCIEMGGQWISPAHSEILSLAKELQIPTFKVYDQGKSILHKSGKNLLYTEIIPCGILAKLDLWMTTKKLNRMAKSISDMNPWEGDNAAKYDQTSIAGWMESNMHTRQGKSLMAVAIQAVYGESGQLISLLDLLSSITGAGGDINEIIDDAQSMRFSYGPQSVSQGMQKTMPKESIHFNQTVRLVEDDGKIITISTDDQVYRCKKVIMTMPRVLLSKVQFKPALPSISSQFLQHQPMGSVIKINVVYNRPFWRNSGLTGAVICGDKDSPIQITYDNSPEISKEGVLVTFISGNEGRYHFDSSIEDRKRIVLESLVAFFGQEASQPIAYHDKVWAADEMALGAYGSFYPPGVLTAFKSATHITKIGNVYLAGDGISGAWQGYMEGAVRSGKRAAQDVYNDDAAAAVLP